MESKPSRIPRRVSVQPSSSRSVRTGTGSGGTNITDSYHMRESSLRPESGCQESSRLHSSSRDWAIGESEVYESPWKLPASSPTRYSGTLDRPWSGRFLGSRNRLSTSSSSPLTSSWLGESERTQGAYSSRLHNQQQDTDSKRPKLSYTSTSSVRSNGLNTVSDSSWRYNDVSRSSSMVLGSLGTELVRERRELERTDPSVSLVDCSHRNGDFPSSSYLQERSASSYAQGARPKENSLSSLRLNTSMNRQLPSEHQSSLLSRDHSWNSRSNYVSRELESTQRNIQPEFSHGAMRSGTSSSSISERVMPSQRSLSEPPADTEGRRTTRQLLSRLASSWNQPGGEDSDKSKIPPSRDPERLQKIKESLLSEDSEEEEGDLCRICQMSSTSATNLLIEPCKCTGSLQYVHQECMKKWLQSKINSGSSLEAVTTCELCKEKLHLNLDNFDIHELHRAHANEQADYEFISSGLYLVVLLHLCEQRFSDMLGTTSEANTRVRFINLARTLQAHMDDIETASDDDDSEDGDLSRTLDAA
ncbi:E3 ubiquitin-protein ligase MARCHF7-like isoform X10 [Varanus komodoensis]|uniref:E3 ubiquitin-protein ligase MARCHF7-like isoform X10 n=1 Tax=Varanus komodoensis TaxID=61221 RepID=UPI001CF7C8DD|nr:E3 ubiquitin-protein ligase MARCHF7-like isoform X10 [Varanus komodoensis]XP_044274034.1 E3 ubiquitin-protein ligase MARCHF7-like isoform X10 [Varanus komodoensis]XP_044274047.1 E3 ubiquitin-protein ligase MARCHF7-like isoform X10 [Varanus komodoensis]